jgi:hypothetical protein
MAAPLTPHWIQPSHPAIQKVLLSNDQDFTTKSISLVTLPPYALFAKFSFPPCTKADKPTYATVQIGRDEHMNLNSDLVYINHSCSPSVVSSPFPLLLSPLFSLFTLLKSTSSRFSLSPPGFPIPFTLPLPLPHHHRTNQTLIWAQM